MLDAIFKVVITAVVSGTIGYCVSIVKTYKAQREAIKSLLRANITNSYYVYREIEKIPYYVKESLLKEYEAYTGLKGNSFVSTLIEEIKEWEIGE